MRFPPSGAVCAGLVLNRERLVGWDVLHGVVGESGSATNHQVRVDHLHEVHRGLHVLEAGDGDGAVAGAENEVDLVHGDVPVVVGLMIVCGRGMWEVNVRLQCVVLAVEIVVDGVGHVVGDVTD